MQASTKVSGEKISFKKSMELCRQLKGKSTSSAENFLQNLIDEKQSFNRKFYTKTAKGFLSLLKSAEANAKQKNMDTNKLFIRNIRSDKGEKFVRPKSKAKFRGRVAKITNLQIILEER